MKGEEGKVKRRKEIKKEVKRQRDVEKTRREGRADEGRDKGGKKDTEIVHKKLRKEGGRGIRIRRKAEEE